MFFSFFKRKEAVAEPVVTPSPKIKQLTELKTINNQEVPKGVNPPSWKDKSVWLETVKYKPEVEIQCRELQYAITDLLRNIKDPEKPNTLEDLNVITEDSVQVQPLDDNIGFMVRIDFNPTVPHCSLASLIGLCLRTKIQVNLADRLKLDIVIAEGKHSTEEEINKQINDKERVAAALENPNLKQIVETCIKEND